MEKGERERNRFEKEKERVGEGGREGRRRREKEFGSSAPLTRPQGVRPGLVPPVGPAEQDPAGRIFGLNSCSATFR